MSEQEFLGSVAKKSTYKSYKGGLKLFKEWYGKTAEEILEERKDDLTQRVGENLVEYRQRAARFGRELEKFHRYLIEKKGLKMNSARVSLSGILQLFRFYEMPLKLRNGSSTKETEETDNDFPMQIEHVRKMFAVADLRERVILTMSTDLGLRITDFISLKKASLPDLDQEPPISFNVMTAKRKILARGFLSKETVDLLKTYLPSLKQIALKKSKETKRTYNNAYLFPSNCSSHISDQWTNDLLRALALKAGIDTGDKSLHYHCFRKMFLSASVDSGAGLVSGKLLCGKKMSKSDSTYLTVLQLRQRFKQIKRFLSIIEEPKVAEETEGLKAAILKLQEDLTMQKRITETISEESIELKPLLDFVRQINTDDLRNYVEVVTDTENIRKAQREGKDQSEREGKYRDLNDAEQDRFTDLADNLSFALAKLLKNLAALKHKKES